MRTIRKLTKRLVGLVADWSLSVVGIDFEIDFPGWFIYIFFFSGQKLAKSWRARLLL